MEEIIQRNISETLENAKHYKSNLEELLNSLTLAENQIQVSALHTEKQLEERFSQLKRNILDTIDERKKLLTTQVKQVEETSLAPLQQCRGLIQKSLDNADILLNEGSVILKRSNNEAQESLTTFNEKAAEIVSLPEVPSLSDVACISISFNDTWINKLTSHINNYGTVSPQGPVQITETIEQPGAITVF
ncbi:PREDICTED: cytokine receptor-like factor 3, partial [Priapulus caudatus]|uniref:Cytokine receptor-like factor 3 n=1 Tax=Priapulus caudatus TaxID=37621 RepID=A0ABM1DWJ4_PRICU